MECVAAQVKRWLNVARTEHDPPAAQKAFQILKSTSVSAEAGSGPPAPTELFILCCEQAISMDLWDMAQQCEDAFQGQMTCNRMLEARALYCEGIVQAHFIAEDLQWNEVIEERLHCASRIIRGITIAVEEWPREAWAVVHGAEKLWQVIAPLYQFGHFKAIIDIIGFVVTLHEKLMIGGGNTSIQWVTRLAVCLRGAGRIHDAISQLNNAMESAVRINNERLQVQLLRMLTTFMAEGGTSSGSKSKQIDSGKFLLHQAVQVSQLFMVGQADVTASKPDLISVYDRLVAAGNAEREPSQPAPAQPTKIKGKSKNPIPELLGDADTIQEVLSDVVLCLAFCNESKRCEESIQKLRSSVNTRARTFGNYAHIMATAYESGVMDVIDSPDASYLTPPIIDTLFQCIQEIESAMDGAKMIQDGSERSYSLQVGCSLLWNFCLPLLQDETHANLQHVLSRIVKETDERSLSEPEFQVRAEYESCVAEFNEDNLSLVARRVRKALSRGYSVTHPDGTVYFPMNFSLLWLLRRCEIRTVADSSELSSTQDQAMYHLEQAEAATITAKCVGAIKTAFSKLPLLTPDTKQDAAAVVASMKEPREGGNKKVKPSDTLPHHPPKLSLARLYLQLLKDCVDNLSPSLLSIAKSTALALSNMEIAYDVKYTEFIYMKAYASLLLSQVLLMEYETASPEEKKTVSVALFEAFRNASATESALQSIGCSSAWMTINSCLLYLDYKAPTFSGGNFEGVSSELAELYNFFIGLRIDFERESSLTVDLSLVYILALLDDYVRAKGGFPSPQPTSYDEFLEALVCFAPKTGDGKNDQSLAALKRAQEVCVEVMQRVLLPSEKTHISRLYPAILRLLGVKAEGSFHHPQEQLLHLLGRIAGPLTKEEKKLLITREAWELLQMDPSVQLCGQVALYATELEEERLVLDICKLADSLYRNGKLGWGTMYLTAQMSAEKDKGSKQEKKEALISGGVANPKAVFPKPKYLDWFWYSKLLLFQAEVLSRRCGGIASESRESLSLTVLSLCSNSSIAASHAPPHSRHGQIVAAIDLFYRTLCDLWRCGSRGKKILPSLKMLLSGHVLSHLHVDATEKNGHGAAMQDLFEVMSNLGHMMIRACAMEGLFMEGMSALTAVLQVLPKKFHSSFKVQEVKFRCEMGLPVHTILHSAKAEDVETASLVWMTFAQNTTDQTKSVEAWKYAVNVLTGYPCAKANCILEMVQHVSVHGLLTTKEVKLLLLSALDLLEMFDRAVNESCVNASFALQPLMDERARTYPSRLIATLTGRSLILPAVGSASSSVHAATLKKNLPPVTLKDIMMAIRVVFLLFCISPVRVEKGCPDDHMSKRECAMLLLHYIDCLWRLSASIVAKKLKCAKGTTSVPPLELPTSFGDWFGFFFREEHAELVRASATADSKHNTEGMQGIFLELGRYLLSEHLQHYCFMVYMWAAFAAGWRYGCKDIRYVVVKRTAFMCCKMAAASCGCGRQTHLFTLPDLTPSQLAALDIKLGEVHLSGPLPPSTCILFSPHIGSLQDVLLRRALVLESFGRVKESQMFVDKIQRRCELLEDWDSFARCILIRIKQLTIENKFRHAMELMTTHELNGLIEKLSPDQWLEWEKRKAEIRMGLEKSSEIVQVNSLFVNAAHRLCSKFPLNTVGHDVGQILIPKIIESYQTFLIRYITQDVTFGSLKLATQESGLLKGLLSELCDSLENSDSWIVRFVVVECRYRLRCIILETQSIEDTVTILRSLAKESAMVECLLQEIAVTSAEVSTTLCLETTDTPLRPSVCVFESHLLFFRAENIMTRLRIAQLVLDAYRGLTMEELGIPTGGPAHLEKHVLDFMRDPMKRRGPEADQEAQRLREAKWSRKLDDIDDETRNAFDYYRLSLDLIGDVSAFDCRAALYQAKEIAGPKFSPAYFLNARAIARTELRCLLEKELEVETSAVSVEARIEDLLNKKWSLCPIFPVEKVVLGKKGGSEKSKKSKDLLGDWKPRIAPLEITESEAGVLNYVFEAIKDASQKFDFNFLYESYLIIADFFMMWQRPQAAGTAAEFAQTARLVGYLAEMSLLMMEDTEEGRCWKCLRNVMVKSPMLTYSCSFEELRKEAREASPVLSYIDFPSEWPEEPESNQSFALPDTVTLSIVQLQNQKNYFLVVLRHPDGTVDCRRKNIRLDRIKELVSEYEGFVELKRQAILEEARIGNVRPDASVTVSDLQDFLCALYQTLQPLFEDMEESLENLAPKYSLYLCLDPILQPLPLDHLPCFSGFVSVQREISIVSIKRKMDVKTTKNSTVLYVVDPFGDNLGSVEAFGSEKKSSKENHILTSTDKAFPFSMEYLMWVLEQPTYQAVLFNMCGSLSSILSPVAVSSIKWSHITTVMIGADAVNEASMRREQKNELTKDSRTRMFDKKWLMPLLLLLRGVRYVAMNTCPSTPPANDALCKRVVLALSTGKGIFEAATGRHMAAKNSKDPKKVVESTKKDLVMFYGVASLGAGKSK